MTTATPMPRRNLTVKITVEYLSCRCYDYVQQAKDKARECGFPLGLRIVFPDGRDLCMIREDDPEAMTSFETLLDGIAAKAREDTASLAARPAALAKGMRVRYEGKTAVVHEVRNGQDGPVVCLQFDPPYQPYGPDAKVVVFQSDVEPL